MNHMDRHVTHHARARARSVSRDWLKPLLGPGASGAFFPLQVQIQPKLCPEHMAALKPSFASIGGGLENSLGPGPRAPHTCPFLTWRMAGVSMSGCCRMSVLSPAGEGADVLKWALYCPGMKHCCFIRTTYNHVIRKIGIHGAITESFTRRRTWAPIC